MKTRFAAAQLDYVPNIGFQGVNLVGAVAQILEGSAWSRLLDGIWIPLSNQMQDSPAVFYNGLHQHLNQGDSRENPIRGRT